MIRTYDDITVVDRFLIDSAVSARTSIHAADLQEEALQHFRQDAAPEPLHYLRWGAYNSEGGAVLYFPSAQRGGIAWGADAQWTDADSADDALERYFGVDGKSMVP